VILNVLETGINAVSFWLVF